jgi:hypothetical protein
MRATVVLALSAISFSVLSYAQAKQKTHTFTNPDGAFTFTYPSDFRICPKGEMKACNDTYIPVCNDAAMVCVVYPDAAFEGTNFGATSFQVKIVLRRDNIPPMSSDECITPYPEVQGDYVPPWPEFLVSAEHPVEVIDGVSFLHGVKGGAAMSHSNSIDLYRVFRNGTCFELSTSSTETDPNASDPPMKTLSTFELKRVSDTMSEILHTFHFTK